MMNFAVIGLGSIASRHRKNFKILFPASIVYAMSSSGRTPDGDVDDCDGLIDTMEGLIAKGLTMAIVASPAPFHAVHAIALLKAGVPTLIEKPITTTTAQADSIINVANENKTPAAVGYCLRYLPSAQRIKKYLKQNIVGKIYNVNVEIGQYLPSWRPDKNYKDCVSANRALGGGALFELSHEFDYLMWLFGDLDVKCSVLRSSKELALNVEDSADILALAENNAVVSIHLDFLQRSTIRKCDIIGSEGRLDWDLINNSLIFSDDEKMETLYEDKSLDKNQMYLSMIEDFLQLAKGKKNNCIMLNEAKSVIDLIDTIRKKDIEQ